jgi:hypothetical protein
MMVSQQLSLVEQNPEGVAKYASAQREVIRLRTRSLITPSGVAFSEALQMGSIGGGEGYSVYRKNAIEALSRANQPITPESIGRAIVKKAGDSRAIGGPATLFAKLLMTSSLGYGTYHDVSSANPEERSRLLFVSAVTVVLGGIGGTFGGMYSMSQAVRRLGNMQEQVQKFKEGPKYQGMSKDLQVEALKQFKIAATRKLSLSLTLGYYAGGALFGLIAYKGTDALTKT